MDAVCGGLIFPGASTHCVWFVGDRNRSPALLFFFFFNDTATPEIYPLSLHAALPISLRCPAPPATRPSAARSGRRRRLALAARRDRPAFRAPSADCRHRRDRGGGRRARRRCSTG